MKIVNKRKFHLIHGFNVSDDGVGTIGRLRPYIIDQGGVPIPHSTGYTGLIELRCMNKRAVRKMKPRIGKDDVIVGHSNGCLIAWRLLEAGCKPAAVVTINPALRRDTIWPPNVLVINLYSSHDWVVELGRIWSRLVSLGGIRPHGWGAAGRRGFDQIHGNMIQYNMGDDYWEMPVKSHSGIFKTPSTTNYWTQKFCDAVEKNAP